VRRYSHFDVADIKNGDEETFLPNKSLSVHSVSVDVKRDAVPFDESEFYSFQDPFFIETSGIFLLFFLSFFPSFFFLFFLF
jgi:hypothetical protein